MSCRNNAFTDVCLLLAVLQNVSGDMNKKMTQQPGVEGHSPRDARNTSQATMHEAVKTYRHLDVHQGKGVGLSPSAGDLLTLNTAQPNCFHYKLIVEGKVMIEDEIAFFSPDLQPPHTIEQIRHVVKATCFQTLKEIEVRFLEVHGTTKDNELFPLEINEQWHPEMQGGLEKERPLVIKAMCFVQDQGVYGECAHSRDFNHSASN
jgi:hypothetical protein